MQILSQNELSLAKKELDHDRLVIFPTETVYGLGANALSSKAVAKIFKVKKRASNNPLIVHLKSKDEISKYATVVSDVEQKLIDTFMPGPFTIILHKKNIIPDNVTCNMDTVGIRVPIDNIAHDLLNILDYPIAAPSANISTKPSGTNILDIIPEFSNSVKYIIDGNDSKIGLESTVCKVIDNIPTILRPGFITKEDIEKVIGQCHLSPYILKEAHGKVDSPGMLYKHYAPKTPCLLVVKDKISEEILKYDKPIIIGDSSLSKIYCYQYFNYGDDLLQVAHSIFHLLRKADQASGDVIIIEAVSNQGLGLAIMNRLIRTSNYNYIK